MTSLAIYCSRALLAPSVSAGAASAPSSSARDSSRLSSPAVVSLTRITSSTHSSTSRWRAEAVEETSTASATVEEKVAEIAGSGCAACGKAEKVGGCNGEGRIQGGIGAVPGFRWWPIKAYRPCPAFVESGGRYRRVGQSLDEVAFGRAVAEDDLDISERLKGK